MDTDTDTDTYTDVDMDRDTNKKINRFIASPDQGEELHTPSCPTATVYHFLSLMVDAFLPNKTYKSVSPSL